MVDHEVIVVGGGAMGSATAWHLARDGRDVLLLEQFEVGHVHGSSHGPTRIFRVAYRDPVYTELALAALPWWRTLERESGAVLLDQCGQIDHGDADALDDVAGSLEQQRRPHERLSTAEARARWPGLRTEHGVVHSPEGGFVRADRTVEVLHRVAAERGARIHTGERVLRLEGIGPLGEGGVEVVTERARHSASVVVVAAGAWLADLVAASRGLPPLGLPPLTVTLAVPSHFRPSETGGTPEPWPAVVHHQGGADPLAFGAYAVWAPGAGMKVGLEDADRVVTADDRPTEAPAEAVAALVDYVRDWFPGLDPTPLDPHTCLFTSTPDEHFVIDRRGPVVVVSPCSGHGFKFVPAVGRLAADLATSVDPRAVAPRSPWRLGS